MVALSTSLACRSFELDGIATSAEETYEHGQSAKLLQGNETTVGWVFGKSLRNVGVIIAHCSCVSSAQYIAQWARIPDS